MRGCAGLDRQTGVPVARTTVEPPADVVGRTQLVDVMRSIPLGVILPLETSVLLTIAIKHFDASGLTKGLIAAAGGFGLLLAPAITALARRHGYTAMAMASLVSLIAAAGFAVAALDHIGLFVAGALLGLTAVNATIPLMTFTYERNFPAFERGKRVGRGLVMKVAVSAPLAIAMGAWLRDRGDLWWLVVLTGALASVCLAWLDRRIPSEQLNDIGEDRLRLLPHFELMQEDRQLRLTLIAWMLMGFGNLMLVPLRVEYLAQPEYGIEADAATIMLLTVAIPAVMRLVTTPVFGRLFDRMSFFASRITINLLFAVYVGAFFTGSSNVGLLIGSITLGVAIAGGDLMWMLWVTKFAPAHRVADYMGLHTFFTGIRAVLAPLLAFAVVGVLPLPVIALTSALLMVISSAILIPEARAERRLRLELPIRVVAGD
jgi:predicted MFS family arabinose efflux permease